MMSEIVRNFDSATSKPKQSVWMMIFYHFWKSPTSRFDDGGHALGILDVDEDCNWWKLMLKNFHLSSFTNVRHVSSLRFEISWCGVWERRWEG